MHLSRTAVVVVVDSPPVGFCTSALVFERAEDSPAPTSAGPPERWAMVPPPGARTGEPGGRAAAWTDVAGSKRDLPGPA